MSESAVGTLVQPRCCQLASTKLPANNVRDGRTLLTLGKHA